MSSKILDDMRDVMRRRHYSIRTERSYCEWVKRFVLHFNMKSRDDLSEGEKKIETYLTFLACDRNVAPSTQNQALNALAVAVQTVLKNFLSLFQAGCVSFQMLPFKNGTALPSPSQLICYNPKN
ncbi:MAG: phage integrase N-terminal SAM-like domain-containing protein [Desulfobacterales bacterium]|nr:phage integrase N-terminal SAM-like domain-containing protein [Desulfobacterales bacterium]